MDNCIFCKIVRGEIPCRRIHEDDDVLVFHDIAPQAPVHFMAIPKRHVASMADLDDADAPLIGRVVVAAAKVAKQLGLSDGWRTIVNTGRVGGQEVFHLHVHVLGGPDPLGRMVARREA